MLPASLLVMNPAAGADVYSTDGALGVQCTLVQVWAGVVTKRAIKNNSVLPAKHACAVQRVYLALRLRRASLRKLKTYTMKAKKT